MSNSAETKRRSLFCCHYARLGDVAEAARCAGYPPETAAADGAAILRQQCYRRMVTNYRSVLHDDPMAMVRAGLERLAFGRTNDAGLRAKSCPRRQRWHSWICFRCPRSSGTRAAAWRSTFLTG
ncbi:MAG: hypothetical protein ACLVK8_02525 [Ruminococcus sp.]